MGRSIPITPPPAVSEEKEGFMPRNAIAVVGHVGPRTAGQPMSGPFALSALAALGQPTRLDVFRLLMRREPEGLPAGAIAEEVACAHNTLSTHLAILARAGLVHGERDGRSIVYHADIEGMRALISFLIMDCCDGHPELCSLPGEVRFSDCECGPGAKSAKRRK
jgi:ArsR family transcriptional regulator, arsenate/arsenite/antimonite-responsive transcriptional repressor